MKTIKNLIFAVSLFLMVCSIDPLEGQAADTALYVAPGASAMSSCSRSDPCDFRYAIELVAQDGDVIYARSGTYTALDPSAVHLLQIYKSVTLYGSCTFDASTPVTCDTRLMNSVLDGQNARRVISAYGLGTEQIHIEGFTIVNGDATPMGSSRCSPIFDPVAGCGGGIHAYNLGSLTLNKNTIRHNIGGNSGGLGGGLYAENIDYLEIQNSVIKMNIAALSGKGVGGGALILDAGHQNPVIIKNNVVNGNETSTNEDHWGAGLFIFDSNGVQIVDNRFQENNQGNRRLVDGSSIFFGAGDNLLIEHNNFIGNYGVSAVNLYGLEGAVSGSVERNSWWDNDVYYNLEILGLVDVDVVNNFLGVRKISGSVGILGGSNCNIYIETITPYVPADVDILFNTFAASDHGVQIGPNSDVSIYNNIFTEQAIKAIVVDVSDTSISWSISNNLFYDNSHDGDDTGTAGIFLQDPKLANTSTGDFHLTEGSAAINRAAGLNIEVDIDGDYRPIGLGSTPYDLGADEYHAKLHLPLFVR